MKQLDGSGSMSVDRADESWNKSSSSKVRTSEKSNRHFTTDHLMGDLKGRSVRGGAVTLASQGIKFALQLGSTMVLARLLSPSDFGLIAMVTSITGIAVMFKDAGLSVATVQRKEITHEQVSTLFWINVVFSLLVMLVIASLAPAIAYLYSEPRLLWITLVLGGTMIFGGLTVQHLALLRRQMRFSALAIIEILTMASGIVIAVAMAFVGSGYWSLVGMSVGSVVANAVLVWAICDWRPGRVRPRSGAGSMLRFGGSLTGFDFLNYFTRNADNVIIGFVFGSGALGIYTKAYNMLMLPIRQINGPVSSVMLPVLSRLQDRPDRYRQAYLQAIGAVAMVGMPIVVCAFVLADEAVTILLGTGWEQAAVVFRWLAPAALFGTLNIAPGWLCVSLGRAGIQLKWAMICAPITVLSFIIGAQFGVEGVAAAFSASWCLGLYIFIAMACRDSPVRQRDIVLGVGPQVLASFTATIVGLAALYWLDDGPLSTIARVLVVVPSIALAYLLTLSAVPSGRAQLAKLFRDGLHSTIIPNKEQQ